MPEVQAANAGEEVTTHKHPYWTTMADDCNRHPGSACVHQKQQVSSGHTGLLYYMGRCQTAPRPDQGRNFESSIVQSTLDAFGVQKSHTTPYHPQGWNGREVQPLTAPAVANICREAGGLGTKLPLALYAYRTATHTSTGMSPFQLMYGRHPSQIP